MSKKVIKLFFAMLSVLGAGALVACSSQSHSSGPSIVETSTTSSDKESTSDTQTNSQTSSGSEHSSSSENDNTSGHGSSSDSGNTQTSEDIERQIREQLISYEDDIETKLKNTLNNKFQENIVENVDIKTFNVDTNASANTTLLANGYVNFVGDQTTYTTNLGMPLGADDFLNLTPISYVEASLARDLYQNYNVEQLQTVHDYISGTNLTFNYARLENAKWDLDCFTATQIENHLETEITGMVQSYFNENYNQPYYENIDLKYFELSNDINFGGDILNIHGTAKAIKNGNIVSFYTTIKMAQEDFQAVSNMLTQQVDETKDLAQNYTFTTLNTVKDIMDKDSTSVVKYNINSRSYLLEYDKTL